MVRLSFFIPVGMSDGSRGLLRSSVPPENETQKTLHPGVANGHAGMESGGVGAACPSVTLSLTDGYHLTSLPG
mgnify:CR=1 FL=1|jgi:hypothetical protein